MTLDFAPPSNSRNNLSFDDVASGLLGQAQRVCEHLLPGGVRRGNEYVCRDMTGGKPRPGDGSMSVNLKEGVWKDFATGVGGADLINLWTSVKHVRPVEAKDDAADWLGLKAPEQKAAKALIEGKPEKSDDPMWYRNVSPEKIWDYRDAGGAVVARVYRWRNPQTGEKAVRPWNPETKQWEVPEGKRPLYNLPDIVATVGPVLMVEGEKCADAMIADGWLASTVMMGAQALGQTDWSPLSGRDVIAWRDNDHAGKEWLTKLESELREAGVASLRVVPIPADKPPKWDAYDAAPDERVKMMEAAQLSRPVVTGRPALTIANWTASSRAFEGKAPEREWLVKEVFPKGKPAVLAAMGDTGKGMMLLDLAMKVSLGTRHNVPSISAFGRSVTGFGRAVVLAAEDDQAELHGRMERLDPMNLREKRGDRLMVIPLPNAGGAFPLIRSTSHGCETTDEYERLRDQLLAIDDLSLIVIDPLASFVHADLNKDSAAGAFVGQTLAALGAETGATPLVAHHMAKGSGERGIIRTPEQARGAIRGTTAIVDGVRAAYALWAVEKDDARRVCKQLGVEWDRGLIVQGAVVKSNGPSDMTVRTYLRDRNTGLLQDVTTAMQAASHADQSEYDAILLDAIRRGSKAGHPFSKSGETGVWERSSELKEPLRGWGKHKLHGLIDILIERGDIVKARASGTKTYFLDTPDGDFALGIGTFERGAAPKAESGD